MKGILLAGGLGTRLHPVTKSVNKHLLPIFDKPMIYYSLSTLMLAGPREIAIVTDPATARTQAFEGLLGNGKDLGLSITYFTQPEPNGIAGVLRLPAVQDYLGDSRFCLVLGDNVFHGQGMGRNLARKMLDNYGATIFTYQVSDPERYGVLLRDASGKPLRLVEKPKVSASREAIVGLYMYDSSALSLADALSPSSRGEYEITDLNREYLIRSKLNAVPIPRGVAWLDTGTHSSLLDASNFVAAVQRRQGLRVGDPYEVAKELGYASAG